MKPISLLVAGLLSMAPPQAWAGASRQIQQARPVPRLMGQDPAQFSAQGCTVSAAGVNFGVYDGLAAAPADGLGQVDVSCPAGQAFTVLLGPGSSSVAKFQARNMRGGAGGQLAYNLFVDAGRTLVWGDGTGTTQVQTGQGTGQPQGLIVYGRILPRQTVPLGSYSDAVVVTVLW